MNVLDSSFWSVGRLVILFRGILSRMLAFSFSTSRCICCGRPSPFHPLCHECEKNRIIGFQGPASSRCRICGRLLVGENSVCMSCRRNGALASFDGVFPLFPYRLWYKNLLFEWKMKGNRSLSPVFAAAVHKALRDLYKGRSVPCLVPVPPRPGKIKRVGWDQVDELCSLLSLCYGYRIERLLVRLSEREQKSRSFKERHDLRGAFGPSRRFTQLKRRGIIPKELVLIDDIVTSGATVLACADILKRGLVENVRVLSLFIVD